MKKPLNIVLLGIVLVTSGFLLLGVFVPKVSYSTEVVVNKPVDETWDAFMNQDLMSKWLEGLQSIKVIKGDATTPGSTYEVKVIQQDQEIVMTETLTDYKEKELYAFTLDGNGMTSTQEVKFEPEGTNQTKVTVNSVAEGKGVFMKSIFALSKSMLQTNSDKTYNSFKKVVEKN